MKVFAFAADSGCPWRTPGRRGAYGRYTIGGKQAVSRADMSWRPWVQGLAQGRSLPLAIGRTLQSTTLSNYSLTWSSISHFIAS